MFGILQLVLSLFAIQLVEPVSWLLPRNASVLRGSEVNFTCGTDELWEVMVWRLNERSLLTISMRHGPLGNDGSVRALNRSSSAKSEWELILKNATFAPQAQEVVCELLPTNDGRVPQTAALWVQEKGSVAITVGNAAVKKGEDIALLCQASGWFPQPFVVWKVNGNAVESSKHNSSSVRDPEGLYNVTSILPLRVEGSCTVECLVSIPALSTPQASRVSVSIAVPPKLDIKTLIAVTVAVCIITILIFVVVLLFCRRRMAESKKSQDTGSTGHPHNEKNFAVEGTVGKINLAYLSEEPVGCPVSSNTKVFDCQHPHGNTESRTQEVPDVIYVMSPEKSTSMNSNHYISQRSNGPITVRKVTTV